MPPPRDYRDHPEYYSQGDFRMANPATLRAALPPYTRLILGDIDNTVRAFDAVAHIGFVSIDVDYYFSALDTLEIFRKSPHVYLPWAIVYLDDVEYETHNEHCGELLAQKDFTERNPLGP